MFVQAFVDELTKLGSAPAEFLAKMKSHLPGAATAAKGALAVGAGAAAGGLAGHHSGEKKGLKEGMEGMDDGMRQAYVAGLQRGAALAASRLGGGK